MELRIRDTGQVMTDSEFRSLHPNTSFPPQLTVELLDSFGADPVLNGPQAQPTRYQVAFRDGVEEINGQWFTKYVVGPVFETEEEEAAYKKGIDDRAAEGVRAQRDKLLADSDWVVIKAKETSTNLPAGFKAYREALRDITEQEGFPHNVTWPEKP